MRSVWESLAEWRNWRLPVNEVAAVLVVPAIAAVALGAIQIQSDIGRANSFANIQKLIQLRDSLIPLTNDLQTERWLSAEKLGTKIPVNPADLHKATAAVDRDVATVTGLGQRLLDPQSPAGVRYQGLIGQFGGLNTLHQQAFTANSDVITVISSYGQVINAALDLDQALTPQLADPQLTGLAISLNDVDIAQEQIRVQETIVAVGNHPGQPAQHRTAGRTGLRRAAHRPAERLPDRRRTGATGRFPAAGDHRPAQRP